MRGKPGDRYILSSLAPGALHSYALEGEHIVGRLFGLFPTRRIHLGAVYYLRLATPSETNPVYLLFNWFHFLPFRRATGPVYVLQTRSRHRLFLKLDGAAHFKLRTAISRHSTPHMRMAA